MEHFKGSRSCAIIVTISLLIIDSFGIQVECGEPAKIPISFSQHEDSAPRVKPSREQLIKTLFGDQWALSEYCSSQLSASERVSNDAQIESLYNGTYLSAIEDSNDWPQIRMKVTNSIGLALKSRQELAILCSSSAWGYANREEERLSNAPRQDDRECSDRLGQLHEFVKSLTSKVSSALAVATESCEPPGVGCPQPSRALEVQKSIPTFKLHLYNQFHSFGRLPSGPPHKQNLLIGDYDSCARLGSSRYCLGAYGTSHDATPSTLYQVGMCLPRACSSEFVRQSRDLMRILNGIVKENLVEHTSEARKQWHLLDLFCPPAEDSLYKKLAKDWLSLVLLVLPLPWLLMLVFATCRGQEARADSILDSFNLMRSWQSFTDSRELDSSLAGLNGVKTVAMVWLLVTHFSMSIFPYVKNLNELNLYYLTSLHGPLILQGQHVVPSFFLISGLLVGFRYLRDQRRKIDFKQMLLMRYFRLLPMYLLVWAYVRQFAHLLGSGPLWDGGVSVQSEVRQCRLEAWWVPLLMLANFTPPYANCIITGWHIANDFQVYLVLPLLLFAYRRSRFWGTLVAVGGFVLTHLSHMWLWAEGENYDLMQLVRDPSRFGPRFILDRMAFDYVNPLGRMGTYFMGVLLADLLLEKARISSRVGHQKTAKDVERMGSRSKLVVIDGKLRQEWNENNEQLRRSSMATSAPSQQQTSSDHSPHGQLGGEQLASARDHKSLDANEDKSDENRVNMASRQFEESFRFGSRAPTVASESMRMVDDDDDERDETTASSSYDFKDICLLSLGAGTFAIVMLIVLLPADQVRPPFGDRIVKAIAYPGVRILIELSWSVLLFYLLRTNNTDSGQPQPRALGGENNNKLTTTTTTAMMMTSGGRREANQEKLAASATSGAVWPVRFFKLPLWNVLVKLNYVLMLTHYALMRFVIQTQRDLFLFTWVNFVQLGLFLLLANYLMALIVHLTVEVPLSMLVKRFVVRALLPGPGSKMVAVANK